MTGTGFVFSEKPIQIERGDGISVFDETGTEYLDLGASYACAPVGHCHPRVVSRVTDQLEQLIYIQGSYPVESRSALYENLAAITPGDLDNVWLCNSGTEANEAAIKFARHATGQSTIVATMNGFHGRTLGSLAATWKDDYRAGFGPLPEGYEFVPYGDVDELTAAVDDDTAAVIVEPIQGEGGVHLAPSGYLEHVREITDAVGAAMIVDEIQTGLGRTGELWGVDHAGIVPDILTTAKGLGSGFPVGATVCRDWIARNAGNHGGTFSGGPVICAAANATLDVIDSEDLVANARDVGAYLVEAIHARDLDAIRDVRGHGLIVGVQVRGGANRVLRDLALSQQVLALPAGRTVVRLLPPLIMTREHVDQFVTALARTVGEGEADDG